MKLSIIIPVYNQIAFTKSCLKDLSHLSRLDHEIIVVDNGSSDSTQEILSSDCTIKYERLPINKGFGYACNLGYSLSSGDNVMFLNNDIRVKDNFTNWTSIIIDNCKYGLVGPTMGLLDKDFNFIKEENKFLLGNSYMSGWCLSSSKDIWSKLDLSTNEIFSREFFCYFEDTDLSFRAKKQNINFKVVDIPVVHFGRQTSKTVNIGQLFLNSKNLFIKKWNKKK